MPKKSKEPTKASQEIYAISVCSDSSSNYDSCSNSLQEGSSNSHIGEPELRRNVSERKRRKLLPESTHEAWKSNKPKDVDGLYEMILEKDATKSEMKETLRTLTKSLTMKRQVIAKLNNSNKWKCKQKALSVYRTVSYYFSSKWDECKYDLRGMMFTWDLWYSYLKSIQGHFGTGVASYFYFLRWLFICNLLFFIIILSFLIIPQSIYPISSTNLTLGHEKFTGKEFLTGAGYFSNTLMYYGYYENKTVGETIYYNIPEAYLLTMGAFFLLWLITLAYCLAHSYQQEYIGGYAELRSMFSNKIFAGWDFTIETEEAAKLKTRSIYNELLETLSLRKSKVAKEVTKGSVICIIKSLFINVVVVTTMAGFGYLVYYILESEKLETHVHFLKDMALSLTITTIMLVLPLSYVFISKYEVGESKLVQLYLSIIRIVVLEVAVLGIVVYFRLFSTKKFNTNAECWETEFGQEVYRLLIVDFIFIVVFHTLFGEVFRYKLHTHYPEWVSNTEFPIAWNTLYLIYSQTLTWLGVFYSPMLPLVTLIKLLIIFYMKRISVTSTCKPSSKPWHASNIQTVFLGLTFLNFMLALIAVAFSAFRAEPSKCGPFRHLETRYSSILNLLNKLEKSSKLGVIITYISSPGFVSIALILFCVLVYYMRVKAKARMDVVLLLRRHIEMEGNDKAFLLKMIEKSNYRRSTFHKSGKSRSEKVHSKHNSDPLIYNPDDRSDHQDIINELYEDKSLHRNSGAEIHLHPILNSSYNIYSGISPASRHHDTQSPWKRNKNDP